LIRSAAVLGGEHMAIRGKGVDRADMTATCTLTVISGPAAGSEIEVERELIIGRRDADLAIPDEELSRRHAAVRSSEAGVVIEDLGSLNGTFVDGVRIDAPVALTADATLRVGISEMSVRLALPETEPQEQEQEQEQEQADDPGRTRMASAIALEPAAIPQPQVTRVREVPDAEPQAPAAIPQPQVTRVREVPDAEPQAPAPIPQPQVTRVREVPDAEPQAPAPIPQPQVTRVRASAPDEAAPEPEAKLSADAAAQAKRPGPLKRLLGRLLGRGGNEKRGGA
jgi:pSer/pThr/pTyr-binding forkhead associated (FHA) protein